MLNGAIFWSCFFFRYISVLPPPPGNFSVDALAKIQLRKGKRSKMIKKRKTYCNLYS